MSENLSEAFLDLVTRRLQAVADPTRIRLLMSLERREATVQELTDELFTTHQNVSRHLGILYQLGIVTRRKDGNKAWYSVADYSSCRLIEQVTASVTGHVEELVAIAGLEDPS